MKIIVDGMGGDKGYKEVVKGSVNAVNEMGVSVIIAGDEEKINQELAKYKYPKDLVEILNGPDIITNDEEPALAIRRKQNSSLVVGLKALSNGQGDGFVSAGSTGALLAGGLFIVKRIKGIERAPITVPFPTANGITLLSDAGANIDCKPEYLKQFAIMASIYYERILGKSSPKVALVNIGAEKAKGNMLAKESYRLLEETGLNFIGNIEARDIPAGYADVVVCDGFVGNVILKLAEGIGSTFMTTFKNEINKSFKSKLAAYMMKSQLKSFKNVFDYREIGGAPLLGLKKPVLKAHGTSDSLAIKNAIGQVKNVAENNISQSIEEYINKYV